jgi:hypothetical protein
MRPKKRRPFEVITSTNSNDTLQKLYVILHKILNNCWIAGERIKLIPTVGKVRWSQEMHTITATHQNVVES